jgi:hypothetical protein
MSKADDMKKAIEDMADNIGIPQEALDAVFAPLPELEDFPVGDIATFEELINAPEGTEFIVVSIKDGDSVRDVCQTVLNDLETRGGSCRKFKDPDNDDFEIESVPVTWIEWEDNEGGAPQIPFTDINAKVEKAGTYIGRWSYTVYKVKK